ncbi:hypothetical protein AYL99_11033 [Fonsecaea erecta]|uniref:ARCA protein n=1 Tax=Fonsecaea erecta TaxID=1367422 RepID=A0A178Z6A2_9EURO|nr:hypothetical protein AYL99_11033 [Fonsecaea erecta]OAP54585.1 hypothetical protein AYL99_11033 [Fonsecaea erecta]
MTDTTNLQTTAEYSLTSPSVDGFYAGQDILPLQPHLSPFNDRDIHTGTTFPPISLPSSGSRCPLNNRTEALLLRHFVKELSPWFDVTDPTDHFRVVVPELAMVSEVVLNAIFAISALHLGGVPEKDTIEGYEVPVDAVLAEVYHTRCIGMLISLINEETSNTNDDVLTAAVILRKFEEMRGYVTQHDYGSHLQGVSALFNSRSCAIAGGLAEAAFWQFVRQDAFLSLSIHQAPKIDFSKQEFRFSVSEAPDSIWANRIIFCTAIILTYCFSDAPKTLARWQELNQQVNEWDAMKPASFTPIFFEAPSLSEGRRWPELQFYAPWHATGTQYFHLCKVLLNLYRPDTPSPGAGLEYNRAHRELKKVIMHHTRLICGIAQSNYFANPKFNIGPIILLCGGWVTEVDEQRTILHLLHEAEKAHGWPTKHVRDSLEEHWGMNAS